MRLRPSQGEKIPQNQPTIERRKPETLPPCRLAPPVRRQEKTTCCLKEPSLKPSSSTASTEASPAPSSACSQPTFTRTTDSTCPYPQARSCLAKPRKWTP